jgi:uncharacterized protein (DUF2336 family)
MIAFKIDRTRVHIHDEHTRRKTWRHDRGAVSLDQLLDANARPYPATLVRVNLPTFHGDATISLLRQARDWLGTDCLLVCADNEQITWCTCSFNPVNGSYSMTEPNLFLKELSDSLTQGSAERRENALWYAIDMLSAGRYTEDEIWVFGEVIGQLADAIEVAAREQLAKRLAKSADAPINVVKKLAFDDSIEVAGPILRYSKRLDTKTLISNVRTKSQPHLLAISKRDSIPSEVTDELVTRGNREVVNSVAANSGACFSDFGFLHMIRRSANDSILAVQLGVRKDIPRHIFQQLIAKASADVREKLERERPDLFGQIRTSVAEVTGSLQSKFGPATESYFTAKRIVTARKHRGDLNENGILEYARAHKIEEATVGLSLLCSLPVNVVERSLRDRELTMLLAKACNFEWETTMALLFLGAKDHRITALDLEYMKEQFSGLNSKTFQDVLSFYQLRVQGAAANSDQYRLLHLHRV